MADKLQNTSMVDVNTTNKAGLTTDLNPSYVSDQQYTHARNAVRNSREGDLGTISNEPSNTFCFSAPYKIIGHVDLPDDTVMIFSTDNTNSEIGIGNVKTCKYTKLKNLKCLNFNDGYPIRGVAKKDIQKGIIVTFTDRYNPVRRIQINKDFTSCDDILLFKKIQHACITVKKGQSGNMPNGMYSVAIAYVVDDQVFSDWYGITQRIPLYSETNSNSLELKITNLDTEFQYFSVAVIGNYIDPSSKGATKLAKKIGTFSTKVGSISITDFINSTYEDIPLSTLVVQKGSWQKAGLITANSNHLIIGDLVTREEENYQLKAMSIKSEYVVEQVPANYYEIDGIDVGYYRDENYDFYIQGVYNTGELTDKFHIPGREAESRDLSSVSGPDVYEHDKQFADCEEPGKVPRWQVENTAGKMIPYNDPLYCDRRTLGRGKMGYFQSTELYPDNPAMFGEFANKPIRYHKMPDECKVARYSIIEGKTYVNILGVRFSNIPKFDSPDIVGYRITRSDRKGGNGTVIARGLMTNVRSYLDSTFNQEVFYANYPVNDLSPDQFLSSTQTSFKNGREYEFTPLTDYHKDKFTFYSPHILFEPKYSLGPELKIETEEIADITGKFELVHNHPKQKLMNQFAFWLSAAVGFVESTIILAGQSDIFTKSGISLSVTGGPYYELTDHTRIYTFEDLIKLPPGKIAQLLVDAIKTADPSKIGTLISLLTAAVQSIAALALKPAYAALGGIRVATEIMDTIRNLTGYTDYVYQYNAEAIFNQSICMPEGDKRRRLLQDASYIPSTVVSLNDGKTFNNLHREKSVYLNLNKPIRDPITKDTSRQTATSLGLCDDISRPAKSVGSAFYATSKAINPNQYGQLGSSAPAAIHSCTLSFDADLTTSPILFGGDCVITRFQFQKRMQFFSQNLANTGYNDGVEYDYRKYRNIGYPRFWMDTTQYDFSELLSNNMVNFTRFSRTTTSKHNLDCKAKDKKSITRIDDAYMYLSANAGLDFYVEADYNVDYRDKQVNDLPYFSKKNRNLTDIFRSDRLMFPEEFNISRVYSDLYTTEIFAQQQRYDFDPNNRIPVSQENAVIYSLPSFNLQNVDHWQYFLPANYFSFSVSDYGILTGIHKIDQDRVIFLFSQASPFVSMGRDILELEQSGRKITIGDGGLFAQDPREILPTDNDYGACNSRYAFSNTHLGRFYPSESQGRILSFTQNIEDITRQGMSYWCKNYMPIFLYEYFPEYPKIENPVSGVGYLTVFDSFMETVYITKRDFVPKREYIKDITYDNGFLYKGKPISVRDTRYFNDASWTLSYSPLEKAFVSWHDWHPDWTIQRDNHFLTVKDNSVWKHNETHESFCTFYGKQYPFEIEIASNSGQQVHTVRSIEYILEVYKYKNFGRDRFHVLNQNFDRLIVRNTEQISPLLNMVHGNPNPEENLKYPMRDGVSTVAYNIPFFKEENKYRVNMFWDSIKDRGEFSPAENHMFPTDESGYRSVINPVAIDINKPEDQRKKFRHYFNKFRFSKTDSGPNKFIMKLSNIKKLISSR